MKNIFRNIVMSVFSAFDLIAGHYEHYTKLNANKSGYYLLLFSYAFQFTGLLFCILNKNFGLFIILITLLSVSNFSSYINRKYIYLSAPYKLLMRSERAMWFVLLDIVQVIFLVAINVNNNVHGVNYIMKICFLFFGLLNTIGFFFLVANPEPPKRRVPESSKQYAYVRAV